MRLHNYEILQRKMMDRIIELESGRSFLEFNQDKIVTRIEWLERDQLIDQEEKSEPESLPIGHSLSKEQISDKLIFNKEREIEKLRDSNRRLYESNFQLRTENDDKAYWVERAETLQQAYSDLRWRWDNQPLVEKQTARACTEIVNRIKNDSLTMAVRDINSKQWMAAICEDIESEIKKEFNLNE